MQIRTPAGRRAMRTVAHITRFGTASGDPHSDLIADHWAGVRASLRSRTGVIRARGSELARRGEKSTGGFDEFTRCFPHQPADFTLAA